MGVIRWDSKRASRTAYDAGEKVGFVSRTAVGWRALYRGTQIGEFTTVDEAVAAVEERHLGRDACE